MAHFLASYFRNKARVKIEFREIYKNPESEIFGFIKQEGLKVLLELKGPKDSIYENKKYLFELTLCSQYPFSPPKIECLTPIIHPNIYQGKVCVDVFQNMWTPMYTIRSIMVIIHHLLMTPDLTGNVSLMNIILSPEHTQYKNSSMRHIQVWKGRRNLMIYLKGIGLLSLSDLRFPDVKKEENKKNSGKINVLCNQCYLQNILSYL